MMLLEKYSRVSKHCPPKTASVQLVGLPGKNNRNKGSKKEILMLPWHLEIVRAGSPYPLQPLKWIDGITKKKNLKKNKPFFNHLKPWMFLSRVFSPLLLTEGVIFWVSTSLFVWCRCFPLAVQRQGLLGIQKSSLQKWHQFQRTVQDQLAWAQL